jgi:imidazolonepropionase-like amidohydrolase
LKVPGIYPKDFSYFYSRMKLSILVFCLFELLTLRLQAQPPDSSEGATFLLHKFQQNIGKEKYSIIRDGSAVIYNIDFKFVDRGGSVPLIAQLAINSNGTPISLVAKGKNSRFSILNDSVSIKDKIAHIRQGDSVYDKSIAKISFPVAGYAPGTVQMIMLQYWKKHGKPKSMEILPSGSVKIKLDGIDTISWNQGNLILERYIIGGLIWGNELAWMDKEGQLYCLITNDAEADKLEMMLEPYESLLPILISRAATYSMRIFRASSKISMLHPKTIAITGGTVVDLVNGKDLVNATILIEDGVIQAVGPANGIKIPPSAYIIQAAGKTILPGLWDMHAHFEQAEWGPAYLAVGVTTVRDCGNEFDYINAIQSAIDKGQGIGPHILKAGIIDGKGKMALGIIQADSKEEAIAAVQRYKDNGFVQIKIYSSVKPAIVKAICQEAHRLGLTVTGHVPDGMNIIQAVDSGMDMVNHIEYVVNKMKIDKKNKTIDFSDSSNKAVLSFLKQHRVVIDPTLGVYEMIFRSLNDPMTDIEPAYASLPAPLQNLFINMGMPAARASSMKFYLALMGQTVGALQKAGIPMVAGTDQGLPGFSLWRELELYVHAGLSPLEALRTATVVPAHFMQVDHDFGSIVPGKQADLILVDGNPLMDISNIRKVSLVIKTGTIYKPTELHQLVGFSK